MVVVVKMVIRIHLHPRRLDYYDFGSAHFIWNNQFVSDSDADMLEKLMDMAEKNRCLSPVSLKSITPLEDVIANMLRAETQLSFDNSQIMTFVDFCTRDAVDHLLSVLVHEPQKRIALPLPNWHFWREKNAISTFNFFTALNEDQLVSGFKKTAALGNIGALILVSPAVPLMYIPSKAACQEIDKIAQHYGIAVIIDDVLRGIQPVGERDSIGTHFSNPFIVEGFSKRFGDGVLSDISYVVKPKNEERVKARNPSDRVQIAQKAVIAFALEKTYSHYSPLVIEELERRNKAFDEGLCTYSDAVVSRPSSSHLTSLVEIPAECHLDSDQFCDGAYRNDGVLAAPMSQFYPKTFAPYSVPREITKRFRITTGRMSEPYVRAGAEILGYELKKLVMAGRTR